MEKKSYKKYFIIIFLGVILVSLFFYFKNSGILDVEYLKNYVDSFGVLAPVVFILFYIVITLVGISAAFFTVLAGLIFGIKKALIIVVIGATIAAIIAFYIARFLKYKFFSKEKIHSKLVKKMTIKINKTCENNGFMTIAILRLSFLPYMPLSYASGLVEKLKAKDFILATFVTNIFGSFVFIYLGASLTQSIPLFIFAIILLVLFMQLPKIIKKIQKKN